MTTTNLTIPVMHPHTAKNLEALVKRSPQALLIQGATGNGKLYIAKYFAHKILLDEGLPESKHEFQIEIFSPDEKGTISIDTIRYIYKTTKSRSENRQIVILENSQFMSKEAQNAFLKLLEEPPPKVVFILTVDNFNHIAATIRSRTQVLRVYKPPIDQAINDIAKFMPDISADDIRQNLLKSNGLIGKTFSRLKMELGQTDYIEQAKQLLSMSLGQRIITSQTIMNSREETMLTLEGLNTLCFVALKASADRGDRQTLQAWMKRLEACQLAQKRISEHASHKLQFINVLFQL